MAGFCSRYPKVGDNDSMLYKSILSYTGNNRKLSNYIYALSLTSKVKSLVDKKDYNIQGEPTLDSLKEILNVDSLLANDIIIKNKKKEIGAINSKNEIIYYDSVDEIIDKVLEFNDTNTNTAARIKQKEDKYYIEVEEKNAKNFAINEYLRTEQKQLDYTKEILNSIGLDTTALSNRAKQVFNILKIKDFNTQISILQSAATATKLSLPTINLLLDLQNSDSKVQRLRDLYGEDVDLVLRYLISDDVEIPGGLEKYEETFTEGIQNLVKSLMQQTQNVFNKIDIMDYYQNIKDIYFNTMSPDTKETNSILSDLYSKWHIDNETFNIKDSEVKTAKEIVTSTILKTKNSIAALKQKGFKDKDKEVFAYSLERKLKKEEYYDSLLETLDTINQYISVYKELDFETASNRTKARNILLMKDFISTYQGIISKIQRLEHLDPEFYKELDSEQKELLASQSEFLLKTFEELKDQTAELSKDVAYNFLKPLWGEDVKTINGLQQFEVSLSDALSNEGQSLNFVDRLLLSMTECHDVVISTFGQSIKSVHELRDEKLRKEEAEIRSITQELYKSHSSTNFMFETDDEGYTRIISDIDWNAYNKAKREYIKELKARNIKGSLFDTYLLEWERENTESRTIPYIKHPLDHPIVVEGLPNAKYRKAFPSLTDAQKEYYSKMMLKKYEYEKQLQAHGVNTFLFRPVQISTNVKEAVLKGDFSNVGNILKNNIKDSLISSEDDALYGNKEVVVDNEGKRVRGLPVFYIQNLKDQTKLNKDFSQSMLAFTGMATNFLTMADVVAEIEITKDVLLDRDVLEQEGVQFLTSAENIGRDRYETPVKKKARETSTGKFIEDMVEAKFYGVAHKREGKVLGMDVEKIANVATTYTSVTGLAVNTTGAIANALVGKLQMLIEAGCGEFFGMRDFIKASTQYDQLIPGVLRDYTSNVKRSKLGLLMDRFDVSDDFYEKLAEKGLHGNMISKILGNTSLLFMYGLGEHMLHAQTMLACLNHIKVLDPSGKKRPLMDIFSIEKPYGNDGQYSLKIQEGWKTLDGNDVNEEYITKVKKGISYCNRSMHGAFGADDKGMLHRTAIGRLVMNFRQWMPAHYARRFNSLHYDAELGDFRQGYYVTCWNFCGKLLKDLKEAKFDIATRWKQCSPMEKANLKRTIAEVLLLTILSMLSRFAFTDKEKRRKSKAYALLEYEVRRMNMEVGASSPFAFSRFIKDNLKMINSPIASVEKASKLASLFAIDDLIFMNTVKSGEHEGDLVYFNNIRKTVPFYTQIENWYNIGENDNMFLLFL